MKKQYKGYAYGFKCNEEYKKYKEICKNKNKRVSYTDWYQHINEKYKDYSIDKLLDFEKFLNWKIYKLERGKEFIEFFEDIVKKIMEMILPAVALFLSIMTYLDSMQVSLLSFMQLENEEMKLFWDNAKTRKESMIEMIEIVEIGMIIAVCFIIPLFFSFISKRKYRDEIRFMEDYKECVNRIMDEKSP